MHAFAAGAVLIHVDRRTGDLYTLVQCRSATETEPLTWSIYGGSGEIGETIVACLIREIAEESGIDIRGCERVLAHTYENVVGDFRFYTYVVPLKDRLTPIHSIETLEARWIRLGNPGEPLWAALPEPRHTGMQRIVDDPQVARVIDAYRPIRRRPAIA
jgi:8-oxo-dGTP pyrophosphatase MutT (NUDIX family)